MCGFIGRSETASTRYRAGTDTTFERDLTSEIIKWIAKSYAETGWYGLNFFRYFTLESMNIQDPWPGYTKRLIIILTPTGDLETVHSIQVEIDQDGAVMSGIGGNYYELINQAHPSEHLAKIGSLDCRRDDLFFIEGARSTLGACYAFK